MESVINVVLNIVCPILGICLIVFCIVYLLRRPHAGESGLHSKQKFSGFGITLEVSSITLFFVSGVALLLIGGICNILIDREAVSHSKDRIAALEGALDDLKKQSTRAYLSFEDDEHPDMSPRNIDNVKVCYTIVDPTSAKPSRQKYVDFCPEGRSLRVMLDDLTPNDRIRVFVEDGKKAWCNDTHELPGFRLVLKKQQTGQGG